MLHRARLPLEEVRSGATQRALSRQRITAGEVWVACGIYLAVPFLWWLVTAGGVVRSLPSPYAPMVSKMFEVYWTFLHPESHPSFGMRSLFDHYTFAEHIAYTILRGYSALLLGSVLGIVCGVAAGRSHWFGLSFKCLVVGISATPRICAAAILASGVVYFGSITGTAGVVVLTVLATFSFIGNTAFEVARDGIYEEYLDAGKTDGAAWWQLFYYILLPIAKHPFSAAFRWGTAYAMGMVYFAEFIFAPNGVGQMLSVAMYNSRIQEMWAIVLLGFVLMLPGLFLVNILTGSIPGKRDD